MPGAATARHVRRPVRRSCQRSRKPLRSQKLPAICPPLLPKRRRKADERSRGEFEIPQKHERIQSLIWRGGGHLPPRGQICMQLLHGCGSQNPEVPTLPAVLVKYQAPHHPLPISRLDAHTQALESHQLVNLLLYLQFWVGDQIEASFCGFCRLNIHRQGGCQCD